MPETTPPVALATIRLDFGSSRFRARFIAQPDIRAGLPSDDPMYFFSTDEVIHAVREFVDSYLEVAGSAGDGEAEEAPEPSE